MVRVRAAGETDMIDNDRGRWCTQVRGLLSVCLTSKLIAIFMVHLSHPFVVANDIQSSLSYTISLNIKLFHAMALPLVMNNIFRHTLLISQRFVIRSYCQGRLAAAAAVTAPATVAVAAFAFYGKHFFLEQQLNNPQNMSIRSNIYTYYHLANYEKYMYSLI